VAEFLGHFAERRLGGLSTVQPAQHQEEDGTGEGNKSETLVEFEQGCCTVVVDHARQIETDDDPAGGRERIGQRSGQRQCRPAVRHFDVRSPLRPACGAGEARRMTRSGSGGHGLFYCSCVGCASAGWPVVRGRALLRMRAVAG
jgi:hypothetical protein